MTRRKTIRIRRGAWLFCLAAIGMWVIAGFDRELHVTAQASQVQFVGGGIVILDQSLTQKLPYGGYGMTSSRAFMPWQFGLLPRRLPPGIWLPLWPMAAIGFAIGLLMLVLPRGVEPGHCKCGYNLTGNVSGRCPECGREVDGAEP
ncbi:MAG: hypothetical protein J5J06_13975 [Phycisphaerae bacterium]|nr:hypothetical protein [Phycisphaerae bacterium]